MLGKNSSSVLQYMQYALNGKTINTVRSQVRGLRYNKKGGLIGGRKKRLPFNWRDVSYELPVFNILFWFIFLPIFSAVAIFTLP